MTTNKVQEFGKHCMKNTFCLFTEVCQSAILNLKPDFVSTSGSQYFFVNDGVFRLADHWGRTANSKWRLIPMDEAKRKIRLGFASKSDFHKDNLHERLYFIEVDFDKNEVFFNHRNNQVAGDMAMLRTSTETTKVIRQIRNLLSSDSWTKHFRQADIKQKMIIDLINSDYELVDLKRKYLREASEILKD